jgi:hypothetical protein
MRQDFDFEGAKETSELVLEGDYTNEETNRITSAVIKFARKHTRMNSRGWRITENEFIGKIKKLERIHKHFSVWHKPEPLSRSVETVRCSGEIAVRHAVGSNSGIPHQNPSHTHQLCSTNGICV